MQQRRFRPGDVLDDYCPRERRITDHAIVAMIDDHIKQTRCVVCDAEHEYKEGKVPVQRRKRPQAALFTQVLDGLQGPQPAARLAQHAEVESEPESGDSAMELNAPLPSMPASDNGHHGASHGVVAPPALAEPAIPPSVALDAAPPAPSPPVGGTDEGPVRRPLIRATLPRPEGQPVVTRSIPEFTIRQPNSGRGGHRSGRRRGGQQGQGSQGPMRFGRGGGQGQGQPQGGRHRSNSGRSGSRRGGKKR